MNKREKIRILKAMYKDVELQTPPFGLCEAYSHVVDHHHCTDARLKELGLNPPRKKYSIDWWYDYNDRSIRLNAITRALKKLQKP